MVALHTVGAADLGAGSCAWVDATERPTKRPVPSIPERVASARSSSLSSAERGVSPTLDSAARVARRDAVEVVEGVANPFRIAGLPLEESSDGGTLSHVYDGVLRILSWWLCPWARR